MVRNRRLAVAARRGFAIAALSALTGCAALPDGSAPPLGPLTLKDGAPPRLLDEAGRGVALSIWPAKGPLRARILGVHGFGDYGDLTFKRAAAYWSDCGIETIAYDQRGFGRNPDNRDWPGAEALIADFAQVYKAVAAREPAAPLTVVAHSMGGAVALAAIEEGGAAPERLALLAPAVWGGDALNPLFRAAAWSAAALTPEKRWTGKGVVRIQASDNIEALRELGRDPLYVAPPSSREFLGLVRVMDRAVAKLDAVETPVLMVYGDKDQVIPAAPIAAAVAKLPDARMRTEPEGWHLLLRDLQAEHVWRALAAYSLVSKVDTDDVKCPTK